MRYLEDLGSMSLAMNGLLHDPSCGLVTCNLHFGAAFFVTKLFPYGFAEFYFKLNNVVHLRSHQEISQHWLIT